MLGYTWHRETHLAPQNIHVCLPLRRGETLISSLCVFIDGGTFSSHSVNCYSGWQKTDGHLCPIPHSFTVVPWYCLMPYAETLTHPHPHPHHAPWWFQGLLPILCVWGEMEWYVLQDFLIFHPWVAKKGVRLFLVPLITEQHTTHIVAF